MNFSDLIKKGKDLDNTEQNQLLKKYEKIAILYDEKEELKRIKNEGRIFEYLFTDITTIDYKIVFESYLNRSDYEEASKYAYNCVDFKLKCRELNHNRVLDWTSNAIKCFDFLVIYYINDVLKETLVKSGKHFKETEKYRYLIDKGGESSEIGNNFQYIYQYRNELEHVQVIDKDGRLKVKKHSSNHKKKRLNSIIDFFKKALDVIAEILISTKI